MHPDQKSVHEFLAISEAKSFSEEESDMWTYYVPRGRDQADWDLFYVLLVERVKGKEWKEIIMG